MLFATKNVLKATLLVTCLALTACRSASPELTIADAQAAAPVATGPTQPNLKVAFIGDSGYLADFEAVLTLIKSEGADLVLHQGDFDYAYNPNGFFAKIDAILGPNFPYLASVGNHDIASWRAGCGDRDGCYAQLLKDRMARSDIVPDDPDLNDEMYAVTYRGLKMVFVGQERRSIDTLYPRYLQSQLADDTHIWKICSWHKNQNAMQLGGKSDEMGWAVYETCKNRGAIIATGHEHSYSRTKTLTHMRNQTVDTRQHPPINDVPSNPNQLLVGPGQSFVVVSGLGGRTMREQARCMPFTYPYGGGPGCNYIWAKAYTSNQTDGVAKFGALFIVFNYHGDPTKAHGYFKTSDGQVIDEFDITAAKPNTE
jgi:hypothetical protein